MAGGVGGGVVLTTTRDILIYILGVGQSREGGSHTQWGILEGFDGLGGIMRLYVRLSAFKSFYFEQQ